MTPARFLDVALEPALRMLPEKMDTPAARALILAICLQESRLHHRRQFGGPARGYAQFELVGIAGVLSHRASIGYATDVCVELDIPPAASAVYAAMEYSDVLGAAFARLLLWTLPEALPGPQDAAEGWRQYLDAWRPGTPHRASWDAFYATAWSVVSEPS